MLAQSHTFRMDTRETPGGQPVDAADLGKYPRAIYAFAVHKTFLPQKEIVLAHTCVHCLLLLRNKQDTQDPSDSFLKTWYTVKQVFK